MSDDDDDDDELSVVSGLEEDMSGPPDVLEVVSVNAVSSDVVG